MKTAREQIEEEARTSAFWLDALDERAEYRAAVAQFCAVCMIGQMEAVMGALLHLKMAARDIIDAEVEQREQELDEEARDRAVEYAVEQKMEEEYGR